MAKGNKGEWSEFYTFLRLLSDRQVYGANENLEKLSELIYPIKKIGREETTGKVEYEFSENEQVKIIRTGEEIVLVDTSDLKSKVTEIFKAIKGASNTTFEITLADELMGRFIAQRLNAGNAQKEDIVLKIHDQITNTDPEVGFSIKSMLGSPATLLNASSATNFVFKVAGASDDLMTEINEISTRSKLRDRLGLIKEKSGNLEYVSCSETFERNMRKVDTILPEILANLLVEYYSGVGSSISTLTENANHEYSQISNYHLKPEDIRHKVGGFLRDVALGMVPNTAWDGNMRAHGGYLVVKEDGDVVCYHVYNADAFREYLIKNTKFETPSTTRHQFGEVYKEGDEYFIKLNLQIRFIR